jgi:hypothetical protein
MISWMQTASAHATHTRPPRRFAPDQRRATTRPERRRWPSGGPMAEGKRSRRRNESTASTAKSAKSAKDAKEDNDLKVFAILGVLGALGGECRCRP